MNRDYFWLTEVQFARLKALLPTDTRGKPRVDDRRVISGIVHVLKSGGRWVDAPSVYGPRKTLYNRFVRWAAKGVWIDMFHALASAGGPPAQVLIDSSAVKAHRCAAGGKGGAQSGDRPLARRTHHQDPRPDRYGLSAHRLHAHGRPSGRLHRRRVAAAAAAASVDRSWRQGLRQQCHPPADRGQRRDAQYSAEGQSALEELLLPVPLSKPKCHRAHVRSPQGLPPHRDTIRPIRHQLPRRRLHRCIRQLLVMSPDPRFEPILDCIFSSNKDALWARFFTAAPR